MSTTTNIALLAPIIAISVVLSIVALIDLVRRDRVRFGNKWIWLVVILFVNLIGPIVYLLVGREE